MVQWKYHLKPNWKSTQFREINSVKENWCNSIFSKRYFRPTLPNIRQINKHWYIWNINNAFRNVFKSTPIIAFRKNASLVRITGTNTIRHNQKLLKVKKNASKGVYIEYISCNTPKCILYQQLGPQHFKAPKQKKNWIYITKFLVSF